LEPLVLDVVWNLVRHGGRLGPRARREDERKRALVAHELHHLQGLLEVPLRLAGEADDEVGAERDVGNRGAQLLHESQVALGVIRAPHALEDPGRARLERKVNVLADARTLRERLDHRLAEVLWMRAREADPLDAGDAVTRAEKLAEVRVELRREV